jgi:hypothetical protein
LEWRFVLEKARTISGILTRLDNTFYWKFFLPFLKNNQGALTHPRATGYHFMTIFFIVKGKLKKVLSQGTNGCAEPSMGSLGLLGPDFDHNLWWDTTHKIP